MAGAPRTTPSVTVFDDLGVFRIFAEVEDPATVERFARTWLGTLLDYDERKPADLVETLSQFLDLGLAHVATCEALSIHRSTLKYRLRRIGEISGHDLSDPDTRFNLQLATRAWRTLVAIRGGEPHLSSGPLTQGAPERAG
jgi:DNA-binding PucR family transcriptional regulator